MSPAMKRRILIASAAGLIGIALPATALGQRCGRVAVPSRGRAKVRVVHGPVRCRVARQQVSAAYRAEDTRAWNGYEPALGVFWRVDGWQCFIRLAGSQTFCHRGAREVDGSLRSDDGWTF